MLLTGPSRIYIAQSPWHFVDFGNIFLPNISEDQKFQWRGGGSGPLLLPWTKELRTIIGM